MISEKSLDQNEKIVQSKLEKEIEPTSTEKTSYEQRVELELNPEESLEYRPASIKEAFLNKEPEYKNIREEEKIEPKLSEELLIQKEEFDYQNNQKGQPEITEEAVLNYKDKSQQYRQEEKEAPLLVEEASYEKGEYNNNKRQAKVESENMEFTKNYSDDLLMGQSDNAQGRSDMPASGVDLADFELPPYSGSSSGSEPRQSNSPVKRKSSASSSTPAQATSSQQASAGLGGLKNLLMTSYSKISHVLQWKKPIETGIYFSIGLTLIIALTFFSIISVVAYSALGIIMTTGSIRVYKSIMQTLNKSPELPIDHVWNKVQSMNVTIFTEKIVEFIDASMVGNLNATLVYLKQVLLFEDKIATLKFGFYFYLLTYIGSWFNGMTLITLTYLAMFTLPISYEKNKTQVDQYYNLMQGHVCATTNKVTSMIYGSSKADAVSQGKKQN